MHADNGEPHAHTDWTKMEKELKGRGGYTHRAL